MIYYVHEFGRFKIIDISNLSNLELPCKYNNKNHNFFFLETDEFFPLNCFCASVENCYIPEKEEKETCLAKYQKLS